MSEENLTKGICTLAGKIKPGEETSQLRLILFDYISNVKERPNALDLFDVLKENQEITTEKVHIVYEILMLMGKKKLWTEFCKDTSINMNISYDVKKNSFCFTKFRLMMIEIGNKLTSKMVTYLKKIYDVDEEFSSEWMLLLHLEQHLHVEQDVQGSIEAFAKNLRTAKCTRGAKFVEDYVTQTKSAITECDFKPNTSKDSNGSKPKCCILRQVQSINSKADGLLEQVESAKTRVVDTSRQSKKDLNDLKKKINDYLEEYEREIDKQKASKIEELENTLKVIKHSLEDVSQLKETIEKLDEENHPEGCAAFQSDLKQLDKTLTGVWPRCVGYFRCNSKNADHIFNELKCIMEEHKALYVDYRPVDSRYCKLNSEKLVKHCLDVEEQFKLKVELRDTYGDVPRVEQEEASITVNAKDLIKHEDFTIIEHKVKDHIHEITCMFGSPGEFAVEVKVFGKLISKPFKLKVSPNNYMLKDVFKCEQTTSSAAIFDITFTADEQNLLACNDTNQVLLFDLSGKMKMYCELEKDRKLVNLCCISNGTVFLTDTKYKEIVYIYDNRGKLCKGTFGRRHFQWSSPQGIAAVLKDNQVHVFTSNLQNECLDYFIDKKFQCNIASSGSLKVFPWFLAVNTKAQLFVCNNAGYSVDILDMNKPINTKGKSLDYVPIQSLLCDSSVCVDENNNIFLGYSSEILMYKNDFTFIQRFKCEGKNIFGLAACCGTLAVVHRGKIRLFSY